MLGLRTNIVRNWGLTGSTVDAKYDDLGQLLKWTARDNADGAVRLQEQLGYGYDPAGNLAKRTNNALIQTFTTESRNQLQSVARAGTYTVSGNTPAPAGNVKVNDQVAQLYGDFTWASDGHTLVNGQNSFTVKAENYYGLSDTENLSLSLPLTVNFSHDLNGNLTGDGLRTFAYDAADQLTNVTVAGQWKTDFTYDGLGRKRVEREFTWSGGAWALASETRFIYDGMLAIQERDGNNAVKVSYTRGLDLSASRQGAGGIGGLLARTENGANAFYHTDGSGNVTALMDGNQRMVARYLYDGYGRQLGQWGELADANRYRFSSKEWHAKSGLYYYGFRFYEPNLQRWMNRDPIGEIGGINLYGFVGNNPINQADPLGLAWYDWLNPFSYSAGWARLQGMRDLDKYAKNNGYKNYEDLITSLDEDDEYAYRRVQRDNIQACGDIAKDLGNGYVMAATAVTPTSVGARFAIDELSAAAAVLDRAGLTKAGRSLTKHGSGARCGNAAFPAAKGSSSEINKQAQNILDNILTHPQAATKIRPGKAGETLLQVWLPDGTGAIYKMENGNWVFSHFAENLY